MNILVFGGSGFLGSHVCDRLSKSGHNVTIFDIQKSEYLQEEQKMIVGDILDPNQIENAVKGQDIVYNFAGLADIETAKNKPVDTIKLNILGNAYLLESCIKNKVKRFVYASTVYVYSKSGGFYKCSKQSSELYIENYQAEYNLDYTILRFGSLYGPRTDHRNGIYRFVKDALEKGKIIYYGNPDAVRSYIHVEDAARLSEEILKPEYINKRIVLTGSETLRISQLFKMIEEVTGKQIEIEYNSSNDHPHYDLTPYSYAPKPGMKLTLPFYVDLGQGMLRVVENVSREIN